MNIETQHLENPPLQRLTHFGLKAFIIIAIQCCSFIVQAQAPVKFEARASSTTVGIDENFQVFFTVENASEVDFTPPAFNHFEVLSGPNFSSNVQFLNGQVFKREVYSFILRPLKKGTYKIGPAQIKTANKTYKSNPVTIRVIEEPKAKPDEAEELFVQIELSDDSIYLGQQLILNYKVFTKVNVERYSFETEPAYNGFYAEELDRFFSPTTTEIINGESYTTKIIRRLALFPLKTGTHEIEAAELNFIVSENRGFIFRRNVKNIRKSTEPFRVTVLPLPDGAPASFSGAVGKFTFTALPESTSLKVGEGTSLIYLISGNGDPKRVQPPVIASNDTFEVYKPTIVSEKIDSRTKGEFFQQIKVEYLLIPKLQGSFSFQPEFTYFDADSTKYVKLKTTPILFTVQQSSQTNERSDTLTENQVPVLPLKEITCLKKKDATFFNTLPFLALLGLPIVILLGLWLKDLLPGKSAKFPESENTQHLIDTINHATAQGTTAINERFTTVSSTFRRYLRNKFQLPAGFSREDLQNAFKQQAIDPTIAEQVQALMEQLEYGAYSPNKSEDQLRELAAEVTKLMAKIG